MEVPEGQSQHATMWREALMLLFEFAPDATVLVDIQLKGTLNMVASNYSESF